MKTVIKVEGMTCHHCANHVKAALLEIPRVVDVIVNLIEGKATIISNEKIAEKVFEKAISDAGYTFIGVE